MKYPICNQKTGVAQQLSVAENKLLGSQLKRMSFADLKALEAHSIYKQDYFQRRFQKDERPGTANWHIQESMYSHWLWWFHITTYVQFIIDEYMTNLCTGKVFQFP